MGKEKPPTLRQVRVTRRETPEGSSARLFLLSTRVESRVRPKRASPSESMPLRDTSRWVRFPNWPMLSGTVGPSVLPPAVAEQSKDRDATKRKRRMVRRREQNMDSTEGITQNKLCKQAFVRQLLDEIRECQH